MEPPAREEWGPLLWRLIHLQAISYADKPTEKEKQAARSYFSALSRFLPCPECMEHLQALLKELPIEPHLDSCKQLTDWTHELHNRVNQRLGKAEITRQEFYKLYANEEAAGRTGVVPPAPAPAAPTPRFANVGELTAPVVEKPVVKQPKQVPRALAMSQAPKQASRTPGQVPRAAPKQVVRALPKLPSTAPKQARQVPKPVMGKRTIKLGPRKPVGYRSTGCPGCR